MKPDDKPDNLNGDFSLPLPIEDTRPSRPSQNSAAELIRKKVHEAYGEEPDAATAALDTAAAAATTKLSKHQKFIYELTNSGKSLHDIQTAWHEYYAALPDDEKHLVWDEFYSTHAKASKYASAAPALAPASKNEPSVLSDEPPIPRQSLGSKHKKGGTIADFREHISGTIGHPKKLEPAQHAQSLMFGLSLGAAALAIMLFGFFNERFIAPFIQPSRTVTNTPIIADNVAGADPQIIIPKINVEIPVVYGVNTVSEDKVNQALESGVVHYANTAMPGEKGNTVIVGHSSNNIFNKGKYKFAFVLLSRLENGDSFYLEKDGKRYTYQVYGKSVVKPTDVSVLSAKEKPATVTLITCDPPGTTINRLVVYAEQIDPSPSGNIASSGESSLVASTASIPGDAPTLWSRLVNLFF